MKQGNPPPHIHPAYVKVEARVSNSPSPAPTARTTTTTSLTPSFPAVPAYPRPAAAATAAAAAARSYAPVVPLAIYSTTTTAATATAACNQSSRGENSSVPATRSARPTISHHGTPSLLDISDVITARATAPTTATAARAIGTTISPASSSGSAGEHLVGERGRVGYGGCIVHV